MPSVHQIKNTGQPINNKVQKPRSYKLLKYLLLVIAAGAAFRYFFAPNIQDIPQGVYDQTAKDSPFYSVITGGKKIVWFGADCPVSKMRQQAVDNLLKMAKLEDVYEQRAFLQNSMSSSCYGQDCVDSLLVENCSDSYCLIVPSHHKFVRVDFKSRNLLKILQKVQSW